MKNIFQKIFYIETNGAGVSNIVIWLAYRVHDLKGLKIEALEDQFRRYMHLEKSLQFFFFFFFNLQY